MSTKIELFKMAYRQTTGGGEVVTFRVQGDDIHKGLRDVPIGGRLEATFETIDDDETRRPLADGA